MRPIDPGATVTAAIRAELEAHRAELAEKRRRGEFDHLGPWMLAELPKVQELLQERPAVRPAAPVIGPEDSLPASLAGYERADPAGPAGEARPFLARNRAIGQQYRLRGRDGNGRPRTVEYSECPSCAGQVEMITNPDNPVCRRNDYYCDCGWMGRALS